MSSTGHIPFLYPGSLLDMEPPWAHIHHGKVGEIHPDHLWGRHRDHDRESFQGDWSVWERPEWLLITQLTELGHGTNLEGSTTEGTFVKHQGLRNQAGLRELDVRVSVQHYWRRPYAGGGSEEATYPLGCPVNLSRRIVTRLMEPQLWKWACISSGVAP